MMETAPVAHRAEHPEDEPVNVEEGKPVDQNVVRRPLPHFRQRVQVGGDRAVRQDHPFRRARRARGVDDQRGVVHRGILGEMGAAVLPERYGNALEVVQSRGQLGVISCDQQLGPAILHDVLDLTDADAGIDGHRNRSGRQHSDDANAGLDAGRGPHRDAPAASSASGDRGRGRSQVFVADGYVTEAKRLFGGRIGQRGEQLRGHDPGTTRANHNRTGATATTIAP
jgi:hypothetical protein